MWLVKFVFFGFLAIFVGLIMCKVLEYYKEVAISIFVIFLAMCIYGSLA